MQSAMVELRNGLAASERARLAAEKRHEETMAGMLDAVALQSQASGYSSRGSLADRPGPVRAAHPPPRAARPALRAFAPRGSLLDTSSSSSSGSRPAPRAAEQPAQAEKIPKDSVPSKTVTALRRLSGAEGASEPAVRAVAPVEELQATLVALQTRLPESLSYAPDADTLEGLRTGRSLLSGIRFEDYGSPGSRLTEQVVNLSTVVGIAFGGCELADALMALVDDLKAAAHRWPRGSEAALSSALADEVGRYAATALLHSQGRVEEPVLELATIVHDLALARVARLMEQPQPTAAPAPAPARSAPAAASPARGRSRGRSAGASQGGVFMCEPQVLKPVRSYNT